MIQEWGCRDADRFLLRQLRRRMTFTETLAAGKTFIEEAEGEGVHEHVVEDKANGTAVIDTLKTSIPGMIPWSPGTDSKEARARAASPTVESRNVYLPALADWLPDYLSEMKAFPNGQHDDQVDGTTMMILRTRSAGATTAHVPNATVNRAGRGGLSVVRTGLTGARPAGGARAPGRSGYAGTRLGRPR